MDLVHDCFLNCIELQMGVYLSQPNTQKNTVRGKSGKMAFVSVEMQGIVDEMKVGEKTWRMLQYMKLISEMEMPYSLCLMDMEVLVVECRFLSQRVCEADICFHPEINSGIWEEELFGSFRYHFQKSRLGAAQ